METTDQKIKNIFQEKFKTTAPSFEVNDFEAIQLKVSRKKFYDFHATSFNIYYALAIACTFFGTIALGTHYLLTKKTLKSEIEVLNEKMNQWNTVAKSQNSPQEIVKVTKATVEPVKANTSTITNKDKVLTPVAKESKVPNTTKNPLSTIADGSNKVTKDTATSVSTKPIDLKPKTVYIIKQDTIIRYDSVKVKRRK